MFDYINKETNKQYSPACQQHNLGVASSKPIISNKLQKQTNKQKII